MLMAFHWKIRSAPGLLALTLPVLTLLLAGCPGDSETETGNPRPGLYANRVLDASPLIGAGVTEAEWPYFFQPEAVLGAPGGTFDVFSLGYDGANATALGGSVTVGLGNPGDPLVRFCIVDGEGDDLAVYENAFPWVDPDTAISGTTNEVATVEVSQDNMDWFLFPPLIDAGKDLIEPARYTNLAGVTPTAEGGDRFDLAALIGLPDGFQACYVRLTDGGTLWEDYVNTQSDLYDSGADIDAVQALHSEPAPGLAP